VWLEDLLRGLWNGLTARIVLIAHIRRLWDRFPFYNFGRAGNWYDLGFHFGAGSPLLGIYGGRNRRGWGGRTASE
jgi:hypothetical protein